MRNVHRIGLLVVALCFLLTVGSSVATADLPSVDENDWETAYENTTVNDNPNTNISQALIQRNETAEKVIFRVVLENDKWTTSKETGFYIDAEPDSETGLSRSSSGLRVAPNMDDIGADYLIVTGNRDSVNATWEYDAEDDNWNKDYADIDTDQIAVDSSGNLTLEVNESVINEDEGVIDLKIAHLNESAVLPSDPGFEFLPDPKNTNNRSSITFDFDEGVRGDTEVTGDITFNNSESGSEISDSDDVNVTVELKNESGQTQNYTFDSYPDPVFDPPSDGNTSSYVFSELNPNNYNNETATVSITITNDSLENGTAEVLGTSTRSVNLEDEGDSQQEDFEVQFNPVTANMSLRSNVSRLAPGEVANISVFVAPGEENNVSEANATITFPQSNLSFVDDSVSYNDSFMDTGSKDVSSNESSPVGILKLNKSLSSGTTSDNGTMVHFELRANQSFVSAPVVEINESLVDGEEANADTLKVSNKPVNYSVESFANVTTPQENNFTVEVSADPNGHNISLIEGSLSFNDSVIDVVKVNASGGIIADASHNNTVDIEIERESDNAFNYTVATNETGSTEGTNASGKVFNATFTVVDSYNPDFRTTLNQSINYSATAKTAPVAVPPNENDIRAILGADPGEGFIDVDQPLSNVSIDTAETEITTLRNMAGERMLIDVRVTSANNGNFSNISIHNSSDIGGSAIEFEEKTCDGLGSCEKTFEIQPDQDTWDPQVGNKEGEYTNTTFTVELYGGGNASAETQRYTYNLTDEIYKRGDAWEANRSTDKLAEHRGEVVLEDALTVAAYIPANGEETSDTTNTPWQDGEVSRLPEAEAEDAALVDINNDRKINTEDLLAVEREIGN